MAARHPNLHIVVLPGLDGTGLLLTGLANKLGASQDVTVIRYPPEQCRYEDIADSLMGQLPQSRFLLVAESFAGPLAVMIAARQPPSLAGIVFVATFAKRPRRTAEYFLFLMYLLPLRSQFFARMAQPIVMGRWANATFTKTFAAVLKAASVKTLVGRLQAVLAVDVTAALADINIPSIYLRARHDTLIPASAATQFDPYVTACHDVDGPHFLLQAQPSQCAKHILDFAARFK